MSVETLLKNGVGQREIARRLGVNRRTIRRIVIGAGSKCSTPSTGFCNDVAQNAPPCPPAFIEEIASSGPTPNRLASPASACAPHREWIEQQVDLGRNAVSIYQDLVDNHGFGNKYCSVRRFVGQLKMKAPERFDVLEFLPGEEAQVDYGQGALTLTAGGKYKKPYLFVMTLKYSGKSFRKVVWKTSQEVWAQLHEEAFRSFGGCPQYVVLDNLKEGVIKPDLYEPTLNPVYAAMLAHYGVVADTCRVRDPNRKGTVESAIQHTQNNFKGLRFTTIDEQNDRLRQWEERWASTRIHGRKKRQVMAMFLEEKPHLKSLPIEGFRLFKSGVRTVDDSGCVQVDGAYYSALPASLHSQVTVRIYEREIEILDMTGKFIRRWPKAARKGAFVMNGSDRIFNPSRQNALLLGKIDKIGPHTSAVARTIFSTQGRIGMKVIYGISNLVRTYACADIEDVCQHMLAHGCTSYMAIKHALQKRAAAKALETPPINLRQSDPQIRPLSDYQMFWESHSHTNTEDNNHGYVSY
jgi:transposase